MILFEGTIRRNDLTNDGVRLGFTWRAKWNPRGRKPFYMTCKMKSEGSDWLYMACKLKSEGSDWLYMACKMESEGSETYLHGV